MTVYLGLQTLLEIGACTLPLVLSVWCLAPSWGTGARLVHP